MLCEWLNSVDEKGQTLLQRTLNSNHMVLTEVLLRREAEDQSLGLDGSTVLHKGAYLGLEEAVATILSDGHDPDALDKYGETSLHKAARQGHLRAARVLLENNANPNIADVFDLTPVHWVALNGQVGVAEALLSHGGDPLLPAKYLDDLTPMTLAQIMGHEGIVDLFRLRLPYEWYDS